MLDRDELIRDIRSLILDSLVPLDDDELKNDSPLVDEILDSLGIAEIAVFIEERIGRELAPDEETRSTFASIDTVADFIVANSQPESG
jgi:acyl carrier protein